MRICVARCRSVNPTHMRRVVPPVGETVTLGGDRNGGLGVACGGLLDGSHSLGEVAAECLVHLKTGCVWESESQRMRYVA